MELRLLLISILFCFNAIGASTDSRQFGKIHSWTSQLVKIKLANGEMVHVPHSLLKMRPQENVALLVRYKDQKITAVELAPNSSGPTTAGKTR